MEHGFDSAAGWTERPRIVRIPASGSTAPPSGCPGPV